MYDAPVTVRVHGLYACFTRPEMKVERVTYPVMTPSAARGIVEAIFWKPEFEWLIHEIAVLKPIQYFSLVRNEVNSRQSERAARRWEAEGGGYFADQDRAQRHALVLKDVAYRISAHVRLRSHADKDAAAYRDQFRRRTERGQCFHRPVLGCREFAAHFGPADPHENPQPIDMDLGRTLFDLDYAAGGRGPNRPRFFEARLDGGILRVPRALYEREGRR